MLYFWGIYKIIENNNTNVLTNWPNFLEIPYEGNHFLFLT